MGKKRMRPRGSGSGQWRVVLSSYAAIIGRSDRGDRGWVLSSVDRERLPHLPALLLRPLPLQLQRRQLPTPTERGEAKSEELGKTSSTRLASAHHPLSDILPANSIPSISAALVSRSVRSVSCRLFRTCPEPLTSRPAHFSRVISRSRFCSQEKKQTQASSHPRSSTCLHPLLCRPRWLNRSPHPRDGQKPGPT